MSSSFLRMHLAFSGNPGNRQVLCCIISTVDACHLTSKFLVQPSNAECGGLETAYEDSRQMFQHSDRMFEQILQILACEVFNQDFKMVDDGLASLAIVKIST